MTFDLDDETLAMWLKTSRHMRHYLSPSATLHTAMLEAIEDLASQRAYRKLREVFDE